MKHKILAKRKIKNKTGYIQCVVLYFLNEVKLVLNNKKREKMSLPILDSSNLRKRNIWIELHKVTQSKG